jgi:hypothetical protein
MATWIVNKMTRVATDGFVVTVDWTAREQDGSYTASTSGTTGLSQGDSFTPYEDLTQDQVISWVKAVVDVPTIETNLANEIARQKTPVVLNGVPW